MIFIQRAFAKTRKLAYEGSVPTGLKCAFEANVAVVMAF
jgi:hypothetical protein